MVSMVVVPRQGIDWGRTQGNIISTPSVKDHLSTSSSLNRVILQLTSDQILNILVREPDTQLIATVLGRQLENSSPSRGQSERVWRSKSTF